MRINIEIDDELMARAMKASGLATKRETVESRNDVRYEQGTVYRFIHPAWVAALTLGGWLLLGLGIIQAGLRLKR